MFDGGDWALKANGKYAAFFPYNKEIAEKDIRTIPIDYTGQTQGNWMKYDFLATGAVQPRCRSAQGRSGYVHDETLVSNFEDSG